MFYKPIDAHSVTRVLGESTYSVSMWHIVNRLVKPDFSCG